MKDKINSNRLFIASCIALIVTAISFALRARLETVFGPDGYGLTQEEIGWAFAPAFWGFTLAMIIFMMLLFLAQRMKIGLEQSEEEIDVYITLKAESEHLD